MKHRATIVVFAALLGMLVSCNNNGDEYYVYRQINKGQWFRDSLQTVILDSIPVNPFARYGIDIEIIHNNSYPYRNLWLLVGHNLNDSVMRYDTVKCFLDNADGKWLGSGTGGLRQFSLPYRRNIQLNAVSVYNFTIRQLMSDDPLKGIEKIGIKIY